MKANDFLKLINGQLKTEISEEVLSKLDIELPEGFEAKFSETYLTRERAKNDDEIITEVNKKANKKAFTDIDDQIKELLGFVSAEDKQKIDSVFSTPEKLKLLKPAIDAKLKDTKGKLTPEDIRKVEDEWSAKYKSLQDAAKAEKDNLLKEVQNKNFEFYVTQKLAGYTPAKEFTQMREHINKMALIDLQQKGFKYEFENGVVVVRQEKDGVTRDVFDGENKVTFESLLDKFIDPFLAKSNGGNGNNNGVGEEKKVIIPLKGDEDLHTLMRSQSSF